MAARGNRAQQLYQLLRELNAVVQEATGKPLTFHIQELWVRHARPALHRLLTEEPPMGSPRAGSMSPLADEYELLGVVADCSDQVLRRAYHARMKQHHPDRGGDAETAMKVNQAYQRIRQARDGRRRR